MQRTESRSIQVRAVVGTLRSPWVPLVQGSYMVTPLTLVERLRFSGQLQMFTVIIDIDGGNLKKISLDTCVSLCGLLCLLVLILCCDR